VEEEGVHEGAGAVPRGRVDDHVGPLVHHDEVLILKDDVQRNVLRQGTNHRLSDSQMATSSLSKMSKGLSRTRGDLSRTPFVIMRCSRSPTVSRGMS
jgi:hypothetical protein